MRKLAFLTLLLTLVVGMAVAQDQTTPPPQDQSQPPAASQQPANPDQPATTTDTQSNTDPNAAPASDQGTLPQTASPLPLLGLLGFGATGLGILLRRRK